MEEDFDKRRSDFFGKEMKVYVGEQAPYLYISPPPDGKEMEKEVIEGGTVVERVRPEQLKGIFRVLQVQVLSMAKWLTKFSQKMCIDTLLKRSSWKRS